MRQYIATFPAGTYPIIVKQLKQFSHEACQVIAADNSSVHFSSSLTVERLIELRYFTNVYLVVENLTTFPRTMLKGEYFRLTQLKEGRPVPLDAEVRAEVETDIQEQLHLISQTHGSRNDFYLIVRTGGKPWLTLRLPRAKFKREPRVPGELRPELAHILCLAAGLKAKHALLDPFAGSGAIPLEAARGFGCKKVLATDAQVRGTHHTHPGITWQQAAVDQLDFVPAESISRVITDPPWGAFHPETADLGTLHKTMFAQIVRVLARGGVMVVLSGYEATEKLGKPQPGLQLVAKWPILVSGKKATIYKFQKQA